MGNKHQIICLCCFSGHCPHHIFVNAIAYRYCGATQFHFYPAMDGMLESDYDCAELNFFRTGKDQN